MTSGWAVSVLAFDAVVGTNDGFPWTTGERRMERQRIGYRSVDAEGGRSS